MLAVGKPAPECCRGTMIGARWEQSRVEKSCSEKQKVAEDADRVFAPRVVVVMQIDNLASVERDGGVSGEDEVAPRARTESRRRQSGHGHAAPRLGTGHPCAGPARGRRPRASHSAYQGRYRPTNTRRPTWRGGLRQPHRPHDGRAGLCASCRVDR